MASPAIEILVRVKDEASVSLRNIHDLGKKVASTIGQAGNGQTILDEVSKDSKQASTDLKRVIKDGKAANKELFKTSKQTFQQARAGMSDLKDKVKGLKEEATATTGIMSKLGTAVGGIAGGLGLAAAIVQAKDFGRAVAEVSTLVDTNVVSLGELESSVTSLSDAYGQDAVGVAQAMYQAISAGAEAGAEANALLDVAIRTAIGGVTDAETAVDGLTTVINAYGKDMSDAEQVADVLFTTMKGGKTTIEELSNSLFQAAPLASTMGVSFEELSATLIALTKQGVPTAQAMTQVRAALQGLASTEASADLFQRLGYESAEAAIKSLGLVGALDEVEKASGGSIAKMRLYLGSIEGVQAATGLTGEKSELMAEAIASVANSAGAADEAYQKMANTLDQEFQNALTAVQKLLRTIGTALAPVVSAVARGVASMATALGDFVANHQGLVSVVAGVFTVAVTAWGAFTALRIGATLLSMAGAASGLTSALGGLLGSFKGLTTVGSVVAAGMGTMTAAVGTLKTGFMALFTVLRANPFIALAGVVVATGLAIYDAYSKVKDAEEELASTQKRLKDALIDKNAALAAEMNLLEDYADITVLTSNQVENASLRELKAYRDRLQKAKEYAEAQTELAGIQRDFANGSQEAYDSASADVKKYGDALETLTTKITEVEKAAGKTYIGTNEFIKTLESMQAKGEEAGATLSSMFANLDFTNAQAAIQITQALGLGVEEMGKAFQDAIKDKTIPEILNLNKVLKEEFEAGKVTITSFKNASEEVLEGLFAKLGVKMQEDLQQADAEFNLAFEAIIASGEAGVEELRGVIEAGLSNLNTATGLDEFKVRLDTLFDDGTISALEYNDALARVEERKREVSGVTEQLTRALDAEKTKHEGIVSSIEREARATESSYDIKIKKAQASADVARALGNEEAAMVAEQRVLDLEVQKAKAAAEAKAELARQAAVTAAEMASLASVTGGELTEAQQAAIDKAIEHAEALKQEAEVAKATADAMRQTAQAQKEATSSTQAQGEAIQQTTSAGTGMIGFMMNFVEAQRNYLSQYGDKVVEHFNQLEVGFKKSSGAAQTTAEKIDAVQESMARLEKARMFVGNLSQWFIDVSLAAKKAEIAFLQQSQAAIGLANKLQNTEYASRRTTDAMLRSVDGMNLLDDQTLNALRGQIEQVRAATEALNESIMSTLHNLQVELAQARGDQAAVERMNYEAKKEELDAQLEAARKSGDASAIAAVQESIRINQQLFGIKMDNIKEEAAREQELAQEKLDNSAAAAQASQEEGAVALEGYNQLAAAEDALQDKKLKNLNSYASTYRAFSATAGSSGGSGTSGGGFGGFADGGPVRGPGTSTSDSILARLSNGEWVMDAKTVQYWGGTVMRSLQLIARRYGSKPKRLRGLPGFASGGPVNLSQGLVRQIEQKVRTAGGGTAMEKIQVEIVESGRTYTGEFPKDDKEDLLDMLSRLQARA